MTVATDAFTKLLQALHLGSFTAVELSERSGFGRKAVLRWLNEWLAADPKLVFISGWVKVNNITVACYSYGFNQPDVPKPAPKTQQEIDRGKRERRKQSVLPGRLERGPAQAPAPVHRTVWAGLAPSAWPHVVDWGRREGQGRGSAEADQKRVRPRLVDQLARPPGGEE